MSNRGRYEHHRHPLSTRGDIDFNFSFAFQPILDFKRHEINSFEALIRGPHGESAESVLKRVSDENISRFDEVSRWRAIEMAARLHLAKRLNINLSARGLYQVDLNITATFKASFDIGFPAGNIIFEITESESLTDCKSLLRNLRLLQEFGFMTAIDDFGMGYSGLKLLLEYQPTFIKLDRHLIAGIHRDSVKQSIYAGIRRMCERLSIDMVAEGVETAGEYKWLRNAGIELFQGYYFARPAFESLPEIALAGF